jgi:hypothetical protein
LKVKVVLRNPLKKTDTIDYTIETLDNELAADWVVALKGLLQNNRMLEKNFCFMGFPKTARTLEYLCAELTTYVNTINNFFSDYKIAEQFTTDTVSYKAPSPNNLDVITLHVNHDTMNVLHNHFEKLQGTVWQLSDYYKRADYDTKYAIRQLNNICHELESLVLSIHKADTVPYWTRPSQITTFLQAERYELKDSHRKLFAVNGYDRVLGGVYMHWAQIGKTLFEVFRDESAPVLTDTVCESITELKYYSGEFDIEWGNDVTYGGKRAWHNKEQDLFKQWLIDNNRDPGDPSLSLGYLPMAQVQLQESFGTTDGEQIWDIMSKYLDIYRIEVDGVSDTYEYCWSDTLYRQMQINMMKPGYDFSSRR